MDLVDAPFPRRQPRARADGAPGRDRPHRARLRLDHARLLDHPGVVGARLQDPVGAEGQLADREDDGADLRVARTTSGSPTTCSSIRTRSCVLEAIKLLRAAVRRRRRDHRQDHGARGRSATTRSASSRFLLHVARRRAATKLVPRPAQGGSRSSSAIAQIEAGADALTLPDHATGDLVRRVLPAATCATCTSSSRRRSRRPIILHICGRTVDRMALHRRDRHGGVPLRLQERRRGVDGGRRRAHQPRRQRQQPRDALLEGSRRGARARCAENLDAGVQMVGPECAIPLQTPIENLRAIRDAVLEWHSLS